ncbi:MAG: hypothetical protein ACD_4C00379G0001 [uncultured bacterium (gcode 4)]|uniref:Uncharacterized protein n=1 Tax=uncultured bacterium (gcode 4) TaxID=1234023 RepID=K2G822_9BACT|nr:MAG: hypothetical protein ACD_4C00379G0001 [uncultured bacterium (gcode 4)]
MHKITDSTKVEYIDYFFEVKIWDWEIINNEPDKCEELIFTDLNNLPENTIWYIKTTLNYKGNFIEMWF